MTLVPVEPAELAAALARALAGGPPIAPLPPDPAGRAGWASTLQPDRPVAEPGAAVVLATSGSSAEPKAVVLSGAAITASVRATHARLGGPGDWLLALPGHYVAGLMVVARTVLAGTRLHPLRSDLADLPDRVERPAGRRYLSLVATQLARAVRQPPLAAALARLDAVLLGGGPPPAELVDAARARGIPVVTSYGLSETCGGMVYDGLPLDGARVWVEPPEDRIAVAGPMLFSGYRLRPDLTAAALSPGPVLRTPDRGRWSGGRLEVVGRLDDVVVSGGLKVDLGAVERLARGWAARRSATVAVLGLPDAEWGVRVVAVTDSAEADLADLRAELGRRLPAHALPRELIRLDALPRTAGGKIDRHRLRTDLAPAGPARSGR